MTLIWIALTIAAPVEESHFDAQVNAIYDRISEGAREHDPLLSRRAYAADAVFLDERLPEMQAGLELHENMQASMQALKQSGAKAQINYRIGRRTLSGNVAIDVGYYRVSVTPPDGGTTSVNYRKFLLTAAQQDNGQWYISNDASLPSSQDAYDNVQPVEGLRFDP